MANFGAFLRGIKLSINLLFLKSAYIITYALHYTLVLDQSITTLYFDQIVYFRHTESQIDYVNNISIKIIGLST